MLLWELYQYKKINEASARAGAASTKAGDLKSDLKLLERRTDRLTLTTMAIWTILSEKLGVTEEELVAKISEIDLSDGKLDGKIHVPVRSCPSCGRTLSKRHNKCMYCGAEPDDAGGIHNV